MRRLAALQISRSYATVNPFTYPSVYTGNNHAIGESAEAGGQQFSRWRIQLSNTYALNCVPDEYGYTSVGWNTISTEALCVGAPTQLSVMFSCDAVAKLVKLCDQQFNVVTPSGSVLVYEDGTYQESGKPRQKLKGLGDETIVDAQWAHGRIVLLTKGRFMWSSAVDMFDFTPSLSTQAGSVKPSTHVGSHVALVPAGEHLYVLGTAGGLLVECTGNDNFIFRLSRVSNFAGIKARHHAKAESFATPLTVWSHDHLVTLSGNTAEVVDQHLSEQLRAGECVVIEPTLAPPAMWEDAREFRDGGCEPPKRLYQQRLGVYNDVAVLNTPKYVVISYGGNGVYSHMYLKDRATGRSSVLQIDHKDVRSAYLSSNLAVLCVDGSVKLLQRGSGLAKLVLVRLVASDGRAFTVTKVRMQGRFCGDVEDLHVSALQGVDIEESWYREIGLDLTVFRDNEVQFAGKLRQQVLTAVLPFCGTLSSVGVEM